MFLCSISADFPYIGHMGASNDFGSKFGRKSDQNLPFFFFPKKNNLKAVEKFSLIKNGRTEPIFTHIYDMTPGPLPLGVGTTIVDSLRFQCLIELYNALAAPIHQLELR